MLFLFPWYNLMISMLRLFIAGSLLLNIVAARKSASFCGLKKKIVAETQQPRCCKARVRGYKLNIGVCENMASTNNRDIVGLSYSIPTRNITRDEAMSDDHASEDYPGKDEGSCHVYRVFVDQKALCIPGNIVHALELASKWVETEEQVRRCHVDLDQNCNGAINADKPYDFAVKLTSRSHPTSDLQLDEDLKDVYGCDVETIKGELYLVCPL